jgi:hypothetical protein
MKGGKSWVITSAVIIAGIRLWMQVRGKTKTPFAEWAVGYCALFFFLAIMSEWAEPAAASLAGIVVVGDVLTNGSSLFEDVSTVVTGTEAGGQILTPTPFGPPGTPNTSSTTG